jgi:predicted nucleotidyltransferase
MPETRLTASVEEIREIARCIVDRFHPQKIVLFGSYAVGAATEDSDVDLLVVMETAEAPLHTAAQIAGAIDHRFPLDIVVFRPSKLKESLERKGSFATTVMTEGTVLYEA